jgi:hypothetical protein
MPPKGDDDGLVFDLQDGGFGLFRAGQQIGDRFSLLPLCGRSFG